MTSRHAAAAVFAALLLAGCAMSDDKLGSLFADPAQYQFYACEQLAGTEASYKKRLEELNTLMQKAATGTGGEVVNATTYRPEVVIITGSLNAVRRVQAEKNCPPPPAPTPAAPAKPAQPSKAKH